MGESRVGSEAQWAMAELREKAENVGRWYLEDHGCWVAGP